MDPFKLNRRLLYVIGILVILNLATLVTLWLGRPERQPPAGPERGSDQDQARIGQLLRDHLGFDQQQTDQYLKARQEHREQIKVLDDEIRELKRQMFSDVLRDYPEPTLSDSLLALTQKKQAIIEQLTFQHLLYLKRLCRPEQREKLSFLIQDLFRPKPQGGEAAPPPPAQGGGPPPRPPRDR